MISITTIIFDFGGVLLEWQPQHLYSEHFGGDLAAMQRFMEEIDFHGWNKELDRGLPFAEGVRLLSQQFPHYAPLIRLFDEQWERSIHGPIQPVVELLGGLKRAGYALHGLSNFSVEKFGIVRARYAFFDHFDSILLSGEVGLLKPDEPIFHLLLKRIGRRPQECIFIDDSLPNVETALRLGFAAIHFQTPPQLAADLRALGITLA